MGLPWHRGVSWMQRLVLGLQPGRSRQGLNVVLGPRTANRVTSTTPDDGISTEANERFVLHDREIDTPTLSPECQQPCHQSVKNPPIPITDSVSGPSDHESADAESWADNRRVGGLLTLSRQGCAALWSLQLIADRSDGRCSWRRSVGLSTEPAACRGRPDGGTPLGPNDPRTSVAVSTPNGSSPPSRPANSPAQ